MSERSLPDQLFFPIVVLLAVTMVVLALRPFADRKPSGPVSGAGRDALNLTIEGDELYRFVAGTVGTLDLVDAEGGNPTLITISLEAREAYDTPLYGPHLVLEADLERNYEGRDLEITVEARSSEEWGASAMEVNYSTGRFGESGWETFNLTPDFKSYSFIYEVPHTDSSMGHDYLAIRPVVPEKQRSMTVWSIRLRGIGDKRPRE